MIDTLTDSDDAAAAVATSVENGGSRGSGSGGDGNDAISAATKRVILFTADWHEACVPGGSMDQLLTALAASSSSSGSDGNIIQFSRCNAEGNPILAEKYGVTAVPTFCCVHSDGRVMDRIVGGEDAAAVTMAVQRLAALTMTTTTTTTPMSENSASGAASVPLAAVETLTQRLDRLIRSSPVMLFIKGTPTQPKCGFSRQIVQLLETEGISFASFDILTDESVRQGLKKHSDWPTYPQIYVNGELIGGLDIVQEMQKEGSLSEQWGMQVTVPAADPATRAVPAEESTTLPLQDRLQKLVNRSPVMLFMKGLPSAPLCGFSRQIVALLEATKVPYDAFDILTDEEVRQGLKTYSDWPTFPQLYVAGDLIGGLDIVKEMSEDGSLADALGVAK